MRLRAQRTHTVAVVLVLSLCLPAALAACDTFTGADEPGLDASADRGASVPDAQADSRPDVDASTLPPGCDTEGTGFDGDAGWFAQQAISPGSTLNLAVLPGLDGGLSTMLRAMVPAPNLPSEYAYGLRDLATNNPFDYAEAEFDSYLGSTTPGDGGFGVEMGCALVIGNGAGTNVTSGYVVRGKTVRFRVVVQHPGDKDQTQGVDLPGMPSDTMEHVRLRLAWGDARTVAASIAVGTAAPVMINTGDLPDEIAAVHQVAIRCGILGTSGSFGGYAVNVDNVRLKACRK